MSESFEKAVKAASLAMLGRPILSATTVRAALHAALPHLTAQDVPHIAREGVMVAPIDRLENVRASVADVERQMNACRAAGVTFPDAFAWRLLSECISLLERAEDVPHVIRQAKAEARAEGTRETAAYIERLYRAGLVNRADVLADMEIAADRQSRRIHANGRDRTDEMDKEVTDDHA